MTRLSLAALALLAATCTANAGSFPLPQHYVGKWSTCQAADAPFGDDSTFFPDDDLPCRDRKLTLRITPDTMRSDYTDCKFLRIRREKGSDSPATKTPRREWIPRVRILADCRGERMLIFLNAVHGAMQMVIVGEKEGD
jgi:hypothetical protein